MPQCAATPVVKPTDTLFWPYLLPCESTEGVTIKGQKARTLLVSLLAAGIHWNRSTFANYNLYMTVQHSILLLFPGHEVLVSFMAH